MDGSLQAPQCFGRILIPLECSAVGAIADVFDIFAAFSKSDQAEPQQDNGDTAAPLEKVARIKCPSREKAVGCVAQARLRAKLVGAELHQLL